MVISQKRIMKTSPDVVRKRPDIIFVAMGSPNRRSLFLNYRNLIQQHIWDLGEL